MTEQERLEQTRRELKAALERLDHLDLAGARQKAVTHIRLALLLLQGSDPELIGGNQ